MKLTKEERRGKKGFRQPATRGYAVAWRNAGGMITLGIFELNAERIETITRPGIHEAIGYFRDIGREFRGFRHSDGDYKPVWLKEILREVTTLDNIVAVSILGAAPSTLKTRALRASESGEANESENENEHEES